MLIIESNLSEHSRYLPSRLSFCGKNHEERAGFRATSEQSA
jgi:hypothetical protein